MPAHSGSSWLCHEYYYCGLYGHTRSTRGIGTIPVHSFQLVSMHVGVFVMSLDLFKVLSACGGFVFNQLPLAADPTHAHTHTHSHWHTWIWVRSESSRVASNRVELSRFECLIKIDLISLTLFSVSVRLANQSRIVRHATRWVGLSDCPTDSRSCSHSVSQSFTRSIVSISHLIDIFVETNTQNAAAG